MTIQGIVTVRPLLSRVLAERPRDLERAELLPKGGTSVQIQPRTTDNRWLPMSKYCGMYCSGEDDSERGTGEAPGVVRNGQTGQMEDRSVPGRPLPCSGITMDYHRDGRMTQSFGTPRVQSEAE